MQQKLIAYEACNKIISQREIIGLKSKYNCSDRKLPNDNKVKCRAKNNNNKQNKMWNTIKMRADTWNVSKCNKTVSLSYKYICVLTTLPAVKMKPLLLSNKDCR